MSAKADPPVLSEKLGKGEKRADSASDGRRDGGSRDPELGKRSPAEDQTRRQQNIERIGQPQNPHRDGGISGATKNGIDEKQEHDHDVSAEENAGVPASLFDNFLRSTHECEKFGSKAGSHNS